MTSCADIDKLVTSYISGDIDEHRARAVRGHARECERCARLLEDEGAVASWLGDLDLAGDPPDHLWRDIQRRLATGEREDARRSKLGLWWSNARPQLASAALVAAALALGWHWLAPRGTEKQGAAAPLRAETPRADSAQAPQPIALTGEATEAFTAARRRQIVEADEHFRQAISELRADVGDAAETGELAAQLEHLDGELLRARRGAAGNDDPASRDEVHSLYRQQMALLQDAALEGDWM